MAAVELLSVSVRIEVIINTTATAHSPHFLAKARRSGCVARGRAANPATNVNKTGNGQ